MAVPPRRPPPPADSSKDQFAPCLRQNPWMMWSGPRIAAGPRCKASMMGMRSVGSSILAPVRADVSRLREAAAILTGQSFPVVSRGG